MTPRPRRSPGPVERPPASSAAGDLVRRPRRPRRRGLRRGRRAWTPGTVDVSRSTARRGPRAPRPPRGCGSTPGSRCTPAMPGSSAGEPVARSHCAQPAFARRKSGDRLSRVVPKRYAAATTSRSNTPRSAGGLASSVFERLDARRARAWGRRAATRPRAARSRSSRRRSLPPSCASPGRRTCPSEAWREGQAVAMRSATERIRAASPAVAAAGGAHASSSATPASTQAGSPRAWRAASRAHRTCCRLRRIRRGGCRDPRS